jgi:hypothetical protein
LIISVTNSMHIHINIKSVYTAVELMRVTAPAREPGLAAKIPIGQITKSVKVIWDKTCIAIIILIKKKY